MTEHIVSERAVIVSAEKINRMLHNVGFFTEKPRSRHWNNNIEVGWQCSRNANDVVPNGEILSQQMSPNTQSKFSVQFLTSISLPLRSRNSSGYRTHISWLSWWMQPGDENRVLPDRRIWDRSRRMTDRASDSESRYTLLWASHRPPITHDEAIGICWKATRVEKIVFRTDLFAHNTRSLVCVIKKVCIAFTFSSHLILLFIIIQIEQWSLVDQKWIRKVGGKI